MALPATFTKTDAAELLDISRVTLDKRIADEVYTWPPASWSALIEQEFERRMHGGAAADSDDARFRRARADNHEIEAAKKRGAVFPVEIAEEVVVTLFGAFIQETEGATARLQRAAPTLSEAIGREYRTFRENLARGVERCCEDWAQRARADAPAARPARGGLGADGEGVTAGERGAGPV